MSAVKTQAFRSLGAWEQWLRKREAQKEKKRDENSKAPDAMPEPLDTLRAPV